MQANVGTIPQNAAKISEGKPKLVKMAGKLAYRNLFHDRLSLVVTLTGIVFSVVLVAVQCGLYIGAERTIAVMVDQSKGDLWVVPLGTKSFDDPTLLIGHEKYAALSTPGVADTEELVVGFANWRKPKGGITSVVLVGSDLKNGTLKPWNIVQGSLADLSVPFSVAIDDTYFADLGVAQLGDTAEINNTRVTINAITHGIRSFTTLPYVFISLKQARTLLDAAANQASYTLLRIQPDADKAIVRDDLTARLQDREVMTQSEFRNRSVDYWLQQTGAGAALIAGAALGMIVGVIIVAQTLYASTKDHLNEFATLRALGASAGYIHKVILIQALLSALLGYGVGMAITMVVIWATQDIPTLVIVMTPGLALLLFALTIGMCILAGVSAIFKVTRIDPAGVFSR